MKRRPMPVECFCMPNIGFVCHRCANGPALEAQAIVDECTDISDDKPDLTGYGHKRSDRCGGNGEEWISPEDDKEGEFFEALRVLMDVDWL